MKLVSIALLGFFLCSVAGTAHSISPLFKSTAVSTAYGGAVSGRPPGRFTELEVDSESGSGFTGYR